MGRGKLKKLSEVLLQYHFVHHKSHKSSGIEPGPPRKEVKV
jgi:hypothetical protein